MIYRNILFLLLSAVMLIQCKSQSAAIADLPLGESILRLEKTPCYGTCPAFVFELHENGLATYDGRRNVENMGVHRAILEDDVVSKMKDILTNSAFASFNNEYIERGIADLPQTKVTYMGHKVKYHDMKAPKELKEAIKELRAVINKLSWTKTEVAKS